MLAAGCTQSVGIRKAQRGLHMGPSARVVLSATDLLGRRLRVPPDASKSVHLARQGVVRDEDEVSNRRASGGEGGPNFIPVSCSKLALNGTQAHEC